ncbi:MAG: glycosyltransferase family 39 protein [Sedimentisphaerales bacterium]|nr:glycosyltransferase family 39 protein [Sedimentisphaerales bacterium]MBN2841880.1 glycosyltransferase family 39 protein [Sedimentisphaerales bacterium]
MSIKTKKNIAVNRLSLAQRLCSTPILLLIITIVSLILRTLTVGYLDSTGDAYMIWRACRELIEQGTPFSPPGVWDHRMLRWALSIPMLISQQITNSHPGSYYLWPIVSSTITTVFSFLLAKKLTTTIPALFVAVTVMLYPMIQYHGSQIMPLGTGVMFTLIAIYCLFCWLDRKSWLLLILSSIMMFCAYGAKITAFFFLPGIFIVILKGSYNGKWNFKTFKPLAIFCLVFLVLFIIECVVFQNITTVTGGRFGCLLNGQGDLEVRTQYLEQRGHVEWRSQAETLKEYLLYFMAYHKYVPSVNAWLLNGGILLSFVLLMIKNHKLREMAIIYIPAYLIFTYAVLGTYPFVKPERIISRYYTVCYVMSIIMALCTLFYLWGKMNIKTISLKTKNISLGNIVILITAVSLFLYVTEKPKYGQNISITQENYAKVLQARREMAPILMRSTDDQKHDWKYIKRYRAFYGKTTEGFYSPPMAVKVNENGKEVVYIVLETNNSTTIQKALIVSDNGRFVFKS